MLICVFLSFYALHFGKADFHLLNWKLSKAGPAVCCELIRATRVLHYPSAFVLRYCTVQRKWLPGTEIMPPSDRGAYAQVLSECFKGCQKINNDMRQGVNPGCSLLVAGLTIAFLFVRQVVCPQCSHLPCLLLHSASRIYQASTGPHFSLIWESRKSDFKLNPGGEKNASSEKGEMRVKWKCCSG